MIMVIRIKRKDLDDIFDHAEKSYPVEACGILVGRIEGEAKKVEEIHRTRNILNSSSEYQIDPLEQLRVFEEDRS
jgi:proteasome lid subunit RPN8/RPN11